MAPQSPQRPRAATKDADQPAAPQSPEDQDQRQQASDDQASDGGGEKAEVIQGAVDTGEKVRVETLTSFSVGRDSYPAGRKVEVADNAETRAGIAVGFLRVLEDDEKLDDDSSADNG